MRPRDTIDSFALKINITQMNFLFRNIKFVIVLVFFGIASATTASASEPVIDVWYGNDQRFGLSCQPQQWVNILGNVSDLDGVASLTYSLNGQPAASLTIGPDGRRLHAAGDFNVELDFAKLQPGQNTVQLLATDTGNVKTSRTVTVEYTETTGCALPYTADWSTKIEDVAQVVDGLWRLNNGNVRTVRLGYDRTIAIGDMEWENYEVTVPFTVHDIDPNCVDNDGRCGGRSSHPLIGVLVRWTGHYQQGGTSPRWGWWPMGAIGWYEWQKYNPNPLDGSLNLVGNAGCSRCEILDSAPSRNLPLGVPHIFKLRAETVSQTYQYRFKMWPANQPEPSQWDLVGTQDPDIPSSGNGSVLLIAHHVDASFGKVTVTPIGKQTKDTIGLYDPEAGFFHLKNSNAGGKADIPYRYGPAGAGWLPIMGDWDGDNDDTAGLYDKRKGIFYLKNSHSGGVANKSFRYGPANAGWEPITGDWNRDGKDTVGLYDPLSGTFFLRDDNSAGVATRSFRFGPVDPELIPLAGDWNGDGQDTVGLYHPRGSIFYLKNSNRGGKADISFRYGPANVGWEPVVGDWNGDGKNTVGLYSNASSRFYLRYTNTPGVANLSFPYGPHGQLWWPLTGKWK